VLQHLFVCIWVATSVRVAASVLSKQSISINDNLDHLRHPSVIAISPTISPFGIDGNMYVISPPLTSRAKS
jgi:hypothetical protein